jgi:hypothetical protein
MGAMETDCEKCLHQKVCALWGAHESQDASCFSLDGCDYFEAALTPPNEWVSVEERLPEVYLDEEDIGIPFLVCGPYTKYPFRAFFAGTFWHDCFEPVEVTHWMPLPAPPDRRPPEGEEERHGD